MPQIRRFLLCACIATAFPASAFPASDRFWRAPVEDLSTVQAVQRVLREQGYDPGPADGTLSAKTVQAVKQAQAERGLAPTGRLDRRTVAALGVNPQQPPQPRPGLEVR
jgi:peptidoglycan hydrolase-like protein with peptidoglycan-binding domain